MSDERWSSREALNLRRSSSYHHCVFFVTGAKGMMSQGELCRVAKVGKHTW